MHETIGSHYLTTINLTDALMAKTDAQCGSGWSEARDHITADAGFIRRAGSWRNDDPLRVHRLDFIERHFIISVNDNVCPKFAKILNEVIGERIVVIDDQKHLKTFARPIDGSHRGHRFAQAFLIFALRR